MAISNVPIIKGPNYGGVIYSLTLSQNFSQGPSTLTLSIVSENGEYATPRLNSSATVSFSSFNFSGIVWSYNYKITASEKILEVTLVDNSVVLDRNYVLLWKRGLLGYNGEPGDLTKNFDFSDETILVPSEDLRKPFSIIKFKEIRLGRASVTRKSRRLVSKRVGGVILVGREKFSDSDCDIPDNYYFFNDLASAIRGIVNGNYPSNQIWKATHEGTLREVLASWCADLGYDFYWDYETNRIRFYSTQAGITNDLPNFSGPEVVSKEISSSMEGTFRQYGLAWTARPKSPPKTLTASSTILVSTFQSPVDISYFTKKIAGVSLGTQREKWGGRTRSEFLEAAFLGYVSPALRDLYCFSKQHWQALGYESNSNISVLKPTILDFLRQNGYEDTINNLEEFDGENLPNYLINFVNHDPTLSQKYQEIEQKILGHHGRWYRIPDVGRNFYYCSNSHIVEISVSVDPEGDMQEPNSEEFAGRKIHNRGGDFSHDNSSAQEALGIEKLQKDIDSCSPIHVELKESGLLQNLIDSRILTKEQSGRVNHLVIYPRNQGFVKEKLGLSSSLTRVSNNAETTWQENQAANNDNGQKNCKSYEDTLEKNSCLSAEEVARKKAIQNAGGLINQEQPDSLVSGLVSKTSQACKISTKLGGLTLCAPSDARLKIIITYTYNINTISFTDTNQFLWSVGSPGSADDVAEIRIVNENITDPGEDNFQRKRPSQLIKPADIDGSNYNRSVKYTFAGTNSIPSLSPSSGLTNFDITISSDGYTSTATFSTKPPKPSKQNNMVRYVNSQFNRGGYNGG
jgi:hypothetical protein